MQILLIMQFNEPIFRHDVHAQSIGYRLTRIAFSRKARNLVTCQVSSLVTIVHLNYTSYRKHAAFPKFKNDSSAI